MGVLFDAKQCNTISDNPDTMHLKVSIRSQICRTIDVAALLFDRSRCVRVTFSIFGNGRFLTV